MTTFISHISALQFLVSCGTPQRRVFGAASGYDLKPTRSMPQPGKRPDCKAIKDLGFPEGVRTKALHVNTAERQTRSNSSLIVSHVWPAPERGSYLRIDGEYCVQTPEACFAQLAGTLSLAQLTELAMMLCGTYAPAPKDLPCRYDIEPLTTPAKLQAYIAKLSGKRGLDKARIASKLACAGSGSPMESKIAAAQALSTRQGGMGIPAELNVELALTPEARGMGYQQTRRPDFLWRAYGLAMDYDSREYHDELQRATADEQRRNELAALGYASIVARPKHFTDMLAFESLMKQVFAAMGKSMTSTVSELPAKRAKLFDELFGSKQFCPMDWDEDDPGQAPR